jgi:hypothetical protein
MKKFVFLYYGRTDMSPETMEAWGSWFAAHGASFVDVGNPFGDGRVVTTTGSTDAAADASVVTGYSIVSAESLDDAEKMLDGLPIVDAVRIFEAVPM